MNQTEPLRKLGRLWAGPMVRIRFPPAPSQQRTEGAVGAPFPYMLTGKHERERWLCDARW